MFVRRKQVRSGKNVYTYVQLVHNTRQDGRVRQQVLFTVGREDQLPPGRVDQIVTALGLYTEKALVLESLEELSLASARDFGGVYVLERLWEELGLGQILDRLLKRRGYLTDIGAAIRGMVFNRCLEPHSKRSTVEWARHAVWYPEAETLQVQHLYRALDFLVAQKAAIEQALYGRLTDLLCLDASLVLYDTTVVDMHADPRADDPERALLQYRRERRPQFLVALALSRDGLPFAHEVLPGNTPDVSTVKGAMDRLRRRFAIRQVVFVGDRGMVSDENLRWLASQDIHYIVGAPMRRSNEGKTGCLAPPAATTRSKTTSM